MKETEAKNRGGRPQKFPGEGPRITHATRLRPATAARLAEEADRNHRSLGEEIEFRINKSFDAIVIDIDATTRSRYETRALELNQSFDEYIRHSLIAWSSVEKVVAEGLPAIRDFIKCVETFRGAQIGFVLMHVMDEHSFLIGSYLREQISPAIIQNGDMDVQRETANAVRTALDQVAEAFESKFGVGSLNKVSEMIDDMLISYVEKHTGKVLDKGQLAKIVVPDTLFLQPTTTEANSADTNSSTPQVDERTLNTAPPRASAPPRRGRAAERR